MRCSAIYASMRRRCYAATFDAPPMLFRSAGVAITMRCYIRRAKIRYYPICRCRRHAMLRRYCRYAARYARTRRAACLIRFSFIFLFASRACAASAKATRRRWYVDIYAAAYAVVTRCRLRSHDHLPTRFHWLPPAPSMPPCFAPLLYGAVLPPYLRYFVFRCPICWRRWLSPLILIIFITIIPLMLTRDEIRYYDDCHHPLRCHATCHSALLLLYRMPPCRAIIFIIIIPLRWYYAPRRHRPYWYYMFLPMIHIIIIIILLFIIMFYHTIIMPYYYVCHIHDAIMMPYIPTCRDAMMIYYYCLFLPLLFSYDTLLLLLLLCHDPPTPCYTNSRHEEAIWYYILLHYCWYYYQVYAILLLLLSPIILLLLLLLFIDVITPSVIIIAPHILLHITYILLLRHYYIADIITAAWRCAWGACLPFFISCQVAIPPAARYYATQPWYCDIIFAESTILLLCRRYAAPRYFCWYYLLYAAQRCWCLMFYAAPFLRSAVLLLRYAMFVSVVWSAIIYWCQQRRRFARRLQDWCGAERYAIFFSRYADFAASADARRAMPPSACRMFAPRDMSADDMPPCPWYDLLPRVAATPVCPARAFDNGMLFWCCRAHDMDLMPYPAASDCVIRSLRAALLYVIIMRAIIFDDSATDSEKIITHTMITARCEAMRCASWRRYEYARLSRRYAERRAMRSIWRSGDGDTLYALSGFLALLYVTRWFAWSALMLRSDDARKMFSLPAKRG